MAGFMLWHCAPLEKELTTEALLSVLPQSEKQDKTPFLKWETQEDARDVSSLRDLTQRQRRSLFPQLPSPTTVACNSELLQTPAVFMWFIKRVMEDMKQEWAEAGVQSAEQVHDARLAIAALVCG